MGCVVEPDMIQRAIADGLILVAGLAVISLLFEVVIT